MMDVDTVAGTKRKADTDTDEPAPPRRIRVRKPILLMTVFIKVLTLRRLLISMW